ncbi:MAG: hypothetical protein WDO71_23845 [Bacteroidota bacterium]
MKVEYNDPNDQEWVDAHRAAYLDCWLYPPYTDRRRRIELDEWLTASDDICACLLK